MVLLILNIAAFVIDLLCLNFAMKHDRRFLGFAAAIATIYSMFLIVGSVSNL